MAGIFISYRRVDSKAYSGRLFDRLARHFGRGAVFMDVEGGIARGEDFAQALERAVNSVDAMVVVVGRQWLTCADASGRRRLDNPQDWVRSEVAAALARRILLLPVLVDGASMPRGSDLPENITALARKQASEISDSRWDYDVGQIVRVLEQVVPPQPEPDERPSPWPGRIKRVIRWVGGAFAAVVAAIALSIAIEELNKPRPGDYALDVEPPQLRFEWDGKGNEGKAIEVTVTNRGRKAATFSFEAFWHVGPPSAGVFAVKDGNCGKSEVPAGGTCTARVVFDPQWFERDERERVFNGDLRVYGGRKWVTASKQVPLSIRRVPE